MMSNKDNRENGVLHVTIDRATYDAVERGDVKTLTVVKDYNNYYREQVYFKMLSDEVNNPQTRIKVVELDTPQLKRTISMPFIDFAIRNIKNCKQLFYVYAGEIPNILQD